MSEKNLYCIKSSCILNGEVDGLVKKLLDGSKRLEYDETLDNVKMILELPLETKVIYYSYKRVFVISPRDQYLITTYHKVSLSN